MARSPTRADDYRESTWTKGLYRRHKRRRFKRHTKGQRINFSLGDVSREHAFERAEEINVLLAAGVDVAKSLRRTNTTARAFVKQFMDMKDPHVAPKTYARYKAVFDNFLHWFEKHEGGRPLSAVTYEMAQDYITTRARGLVIPNGKRKFTRDMAGKTSPWTLRKEREYLASLFREAYQLPAGGVSRCSQAVHESAPGPVCCRSSDRL